MIAAIVIVIESYLQWKLFIIFAQFSFCYHESFKIWVLFGFNDLALVNKKVLLLCFSVNPKKRTWILGKAKATG